MHPADITGRLEAMREKAHEDWTPHVLGLTPEEIDAALLAAIEEEWPEAVPAARAMIDRPRRRLVSPPPHEIRRYPVHEPDYSNEWPIVPDRLD